MILLYFLLSLPNRLILEKPTVTSTMAISIIKGCSIRYSLDTFSFMASPEKLETPSGDRK